MTACQRQVCIYSKFIFFCKKAEGTTPFFSSNSRRNPPIQTNPYGTVHRTGGAYPSAHGVKSILLPKRFPDSMSFSLGSLYFYSFPFSSVRAILYVPLTAVFAWDPFMIQYCAGSSNVALIPSGIFTSSAISRFSRFQDTATVPSGA